MHSRPCIPYPRISRPPGSSLCNLLIRRRYRGLLSLTVRYESAGRASRCLFVAVILRLCRRDTTPRHERFFGSFRFTLSPAALLRPQALHANAIFDDPRRILKLITYKSIRTRYRLRAMSGSSARSSFPPSRLLRAPSAPRVRICTCIYK